MAAGTPERWKLWSWEALRYRGSGWWLDRALPASPIGVLAVAVALPIAWFALGYAIAHDRAAFLSEHDVVGQLWFFPLHVLATRIVGGLWGEGLGRALDGVALDAAAQARIRRGALGNAASVGALGACGFFIARDIWFGLRPGASGLLPFDDPAVWNMAALGRPVHLLMLALWCVEWLFFGYLMWIQLWILASWTRELRRVDYGERVGAVLMGEGYRHSLTLFSETTTVSLVFALGNLGFIAFTGELIPRPASPIRGVGDFLTNMSDFLSTSLLFVLTLIAALSFIVALRGSLARTVRARFMSAAPASFDELGVPLHPTGEIAADIAKLQERSNSQDALLRTFTLQRRVDSLGIATIVTMVAKALIPMLTTGLKLYKMFGG